MHTGLIWLMIGPIFTNICAIILSYIKQNKMCYSPNNDGKLPKTTIFFHKQDSHPSATPYERTFWISEKGTVPIDSLIKIRKHSKAFIIAKKEHLFANIK